MKEPGQVAFETYVPKSIWDHQDETYKAVWAAVETAVLATYAKSGYWFELPRTYVKPAGLWVTICGTPDFVVLSRVTRVYEWHGWKYQFESHGPEFAISEADARRLVEALGGTWPEEKPNV